MKQVKKVVSVITDYPACRYNDNGQEKIINSASEEAVGWYDSPNPAFRTKGVSAKPVEQKQEKEDSASGEPEMIVETAAEPDSLTKDDLFRMKRDAMYALAVSKNMDVAEDIKRPELMKLLLADLEK